MRSIQEFEDACKEMSMNFLRLFGAYRRLKDQVLMCSMVAYEFCLVVEGWYVRSGINYGADFVLYKQHPSTIHAEFCAIVQTPNEPIDLLDLQTTYRLCNQVCIARLQSHKLSIRWVRVLSLFWFLEMRLSCVTCIDGFQRNILVKHHTLWRQCQFHIVLPAL